MQVLLVWKVDRFARNVGDHFNIKASLMKYGVCVVSVTEPIDSKPEGKLMETILAGFAQFDNDIRATRTVQGMRRKLQEGIFPWKPPLGYKSSTRNGEKKTEPDQPDQPVFGLLQKAWKEFATGAFTKAEIRRLMDSWGVQTRSGRPLSPQSLDNFFRNSFYAGILIDPWSGEEHQGQHVPMVSREEFARVQQIILRRNHAIPHQKQRPEFSLRGLVRCNHCRGYMTGSFSRGRYLRYAYYHRKCEGRKSYPVQSLHDEFTEFLNSIAPKPELVEKLGELVLQTAEEAQAACKARTVRREAEIVRLNRQIQELIKMRAQSLITDQEFLAQKSVLMDRRLALESTPLPERINRDRLREQLNEIREPLAELRKTWETLHDPFQRRFERLVLPVGFVNGESRTTELGLLFRTFGELSEGNTSEVSLVRKFSNRILQEIQAFVAILRGSEEEEMAA